jgi:hypothetical protein
MLKTQERTIDGVKFTVGQLPAMRSMRLLNRITRVASPALAKATAALKQGSTLKPGTLADLDLGALGGAVEALFHKLPDDELEHITRELLATALYHDLKTNEAGEVMPAFDALFQGRLSLVFRLLAFSFEVNYGDFFGVFRGLAAAQAKGKSEASSVG